MEYFLQKYIKDISINKFFNGIIRKKYADGSKYEGNI